MNPDRNETIRALVDPGVIAVVRAPGPEPIPRLIETLLAGGVRAIEITLTTPNAVEAICQANEAYGTRALLGVGTVLDASGARAAMNAGARFVVTPVCQKDLVPLCHGHGCPVMLGAYTPTEAQLAHEAGADFVKLFPADGLGPTYVKALRAPLPHLRLVPTGGVTADNAAEFIRAGCVALGAGSSLVPASALCEGRWDEIRALAEAFVEGVREGRNQP
jgi:2-dehydro-3-deoxyphosphogluconate aldolase/(4S)-4-hydroxy-2-oxoglutarate aldolase